MAHRSMAPARCGALTGTVYMWGGVESGFLPARPSTALRKKGAFQAIFAFDLPRPRTYNPRPRCFAADVATRCSPLNLDAKNVGGRCLTL
jgi:hypothetical protein